MLIVTPETLLSEVSIRFDSSIHSKTVRYAFENSYTCFVNHAGVLKTNNLDSFVRYMQAISDNQNLIKGKITKNSRIVPIFPKACTRAFFQCAELTVEEFYRNPLDSGYFKWVIGQVLDLESKRDLTRALGEIFWVNVHVEAPFRDLISLRKFVSWLNLYNKTQTPLDRRFSRAPDDQDNR